MVTNADNAVTALVVDLADMSCFEAIAHGLSDKGCWIVSDKVGLLKQEVGLRLAGNDRLVRGTIVAYGDNQARVSFEIKRDGPAEQRREIRRPVWITAVVCGRTNTASMKCRIVDASQSGCRLEGNKLNRLPNEIEISIPGLSLPISGRIVWRQDNQAGVSLNWPFEPGQDPQSVRENPGEEQGALQRKRRKRITAFGT